MGAAMHIHGDGAERAPCGYGERGGVEPGSSASLARNIGRMCGHIAAAIRAPVVPQPGAVIARRVNQCDAPGPDGTTLRRTVVDEIVAPGPDSTQSRDHHAS